MLWKLLFNTEYLKDDFGDSLGCAGPRHPLSSCRNYCLPAIQRCTYLLWFNFGLWKYSLRHGSLQRTVWQWGNISPLGSKRVTLWCHSYTGTPCGIRSRPSFSWTSVFAYLLPLVLVSFAYSLTDFSTTVPQ